MAIAEGLTTEIGPRQGGTPEEAAARQWAVRELTRLGFSNVREETFLMPTWVRGEETAALIGPFHPQPLAITALGNSGSTGERGIVGDVIYFATLADLREAPDATVRGKIVYIDHAMQRTMDGSSYGQFGAARFAGPNIAAKKGAAAVVIRSIGTDSHRNPHTGNTNFEPGVTPIPAGAISNPDADLLRRQWERSRLIRTQETQLGYVPAPLRMRLKLTPRNIGQQTSGNVIAELPGSNPALPPIVIACHLDSWDLGTGAVDDAADCAIITAAARHLMDTGRAYPRTVRLLWAGAEEVGVWGGKDYARRYASQPHALAMESDFGAGKVWQVEFRMAQVNKALADRISADLMRMGIGRGAGRATGGADVSDIIAAQNLAVIDLSQDGTDYFDLHHTPDDTFDKLKPADMQQNVVAWATVLSQLAMFEGVIEPVPPAGN